VQHILSPAVPEAATVHVSLGRAAAIGILGAGVEDASAAQKEGFAKMADYYIDRCVGRRVPARLG
jgi:hypothetical protein